MKSILGLLILFVSIGLLGCNGNSTAPGVSTTSASSQTETIEVNSVAVSDEPASKVDATGEASDALAIFNRRIIPIFKSPKPSSCSECHLSGVDLKDYIRPSQEETFASLVNAGMIDMKTPEDSKILRFIKRSAKNDNLVTEEIRKEEYEAFETWILAAVADPEHFKNAQVDSDIGPALAEGVIRHARKDRVMTSFMDNIWTEVGRCAACHSPDKNQKQVEEHGEEVSWITLNDPEKTLEYMVENQLVNVKDPEASLLLMKPTMQLDHGGGQKMVVGDRSYKQFRRFIDDYSAVVQGEYAEVDQLPDPGDELSWVTDIWLKIEGVPAEYDKMLLQADLYRQTDSGWSEVRLASSDRPVFGGGNLWQHSLSLTAPRGSQQAKELESGTLPPGKYLIKIYLDQKGKLQEDFKAELGEAELIGQVEVDSQWPAGYGKMTIVQFPK